jgi:hypothetical protein
MAWPASTREPAVSDTETLGYLASLLVLATFCMRDMVALRLMAIVSNLAFVGYAAMTQLQPILLLHAVLLPMNAWRLLEAVRRRGCTGETKASGTDLKEKHDD